MKQLLEYRAELLARLARQPTALAEAVNAVPESEWTARRVSGDHTLHQCLAHVRDLEALAFLPRLRRILTEDYPALDAFPSHHWSMERYRPDEPMADILADFTRAREEALALLRPLPAEGWGRTGFHPPSGPRTAQWWAERMYTHAREHLNEMRRAVNSSSTGNYSAASFVLRLRSGCPTRRAHPERSEAQSKGARRSAQDAVG